MLSIIQAEKGRELELVRALLEEYAQWLQSKNLIFAREYEAFQEQLSDLPSCFAGQDGRLLLSKYGDKTAGCVALRKLTDSICEMKRLYVRPNFRGLGIGRALAEAVIGEARNIGYRSMRVHTVSLMHAANALYQSLGFKEVDPYEYSPLETSVFMEFILG